jgi:hypothetical protein
MLLVMQQNDRMQCTVLNRQPTGPELLAAGPGRPAPPPHYPLLPLRALPAGCGLRVVAAAHGHGGSKTKAVAGSGGNAGDVRVGPAARE